MQNERCDKHFRVCLPPLTTRYHLMSTNVTKGRRRRSLHSTLAVFGFHMRRGGLGDGIPTRSTLRRNLTVSLTTRRRRCTKCTRENFFANLRGRRRKSNKNFQRSSLLTILLYRLGLQLYVMFAWRQLHTKRNRHDKKVIAISNYRRRRVLSDKNSKFRT